MDNVRLILIMLLMFLGLMLYKAWQEDYGPKPDLNTATSTATATATGNDSPPVASNLTTPDNSDVPQAPPTTGDLPTAATPALSDLGSGGRIQVRTDVYAIEIDLQGGDLRQVRLLDYPVEADQPDEPFPLMSDREPFVFVAQSGLLGKDEHSAPRHKAYYTAQQSRYVLGDGEDTLRVPMTWRGENGVIVTKIYEFKRGDYTINVRHDIDNQGADDFSARLYGQLRRTNQVPGPSSSFIYTYLGGALSSPDSRYEKIDFDDIEDGMLAQENRGPWADGWLAMIQHYFVSAIVPPSEKTVHYYSRYLKNEGQYVLGMYDQGVSVAPGQQQSTSFQLFVGPKLQDKLAALAPSLELTVDYGYLWFIAQPLFWALDVLHNILGNWGWAIVFLTILIKIMFFYPSAISYRSMANMRKLHPRLQQLKERYADDKAGLNQAMMDLYRKEKINPLGGCLPILIQIPVFIALYWVLLESVELRQAPFILWIQDMSKADPYFILPLVMGATMFIQHKLNPAPLDPIQQQVMMALPIVFTVFFAFFPAGLVLYWVVNNILSIAQQWYITREIVGEDVILKKD
jgi:YidC/Oxa1 family membrane protein insertase